MKKILITLMALAILPIIGLAQTQQEADSLHQLGRILLEQGNTVEGRRFTQQAMDMRKTLYGEENEDYINSLNNYALSFSFGQDIDMDQAIALQHQVLALCERLPQPHPDYGRYALNLGRMYYIKDDAVNAAKYWEIALVSVEKHGEMYGKLLEWLGMIYSEANDVENAYRIMELMNDHIQNELQKPCEEVECMLERGQQLASSGNTAQAKEWFLSALAIAEGQERVQVLEEYGKFLGMTMNDFALGAEHLLSAANLRKELNGENEDYFNALNTAGIYAFLGRQYQQAVDCYLPVIAFYQQHPSAEALSNIAKCQKNLGNAYSALKDYEKAKVCFQQALSYYETHDRENEEYPKLLGRLATAEKHNQELDEAIAHYQQAMQIFMERDMMEDYSNVASSLRLCYIQAGMDEEVDSMDDAVNMARKEKLDAIIKEEKDNLELTRDYLGVLSYARSLGTIAGCYQLEEDYSNSVHYYQQYMEAVRGAIRSEFSMQSETERMATWEQEKTTMQEIKELLVTLPMEEDTLMDGLTALLYDVALLSKGILLNSAIEFEKVISEIGDDQLKALFEQSKANEIEIERLRSEAQSDDDLNKILQLTQENQALLLQLYKKCSELADFTDYIAYTWQDVRSALESDDIAIEFLAISTGPIDRENYMVALILSKETPYPVAVPICTLLDVKTMASYEQLFELDNVIWGMMDQFLQGKNRIFFTADGGFNQISIEYLLFHGKPLSEQFEVYRLSSTKELCFHRQGLPLDQAVLFGDINYNEEGTSTESTQNDLIALRGTETEFINLSNTKREVNEIYAILQGKAKGVVKLTDTEASQDAFLGLSGSRVNLIHIATHGIYNLTEEITERESMQNSILAFAGANLYDDTHNGIVSAADIAKMNLRQCDLAVLSACETGLGQLGDDGVFGLQRGFKNAGVRSLLMSIKKVYDNTTADMMIRFYRHLSEGLTKREALVRAQREIREDGYDDAKYWATFILLDAID